MKIEQFEMERFQSEWENRVEINLTESGVHPMALADFLEPDEIASLAREPLVYVQTNGTPALRDAIAALYSGATADDVVVTNGGAEANFIAIWRLVEPGDEVVLLVPNYMQIWGIVRGHGARVVPWPLREESGWAPDLDELRRVVTDRTRVIAVCNPNNPTGAVLSADVMQGIVDCAASHGCWLLADEVYRGAERDGVETPTFWGRYERTIVTSGLSKAYGLPGLRIGWAASTAAMAHELWARKDYLTISPGALSDYAARRALAPDIRPRILTRTQAIVNEGYGALDRWMGSRGSIFRVVPPRAGAIAFLGYSAPVNSTTLMEQLRDEHGVLVVPGDQFHMDGYLRIGTGGHVRDLEAGLERLDRVLATVERR